MRHPSGRSKRSPARANQDRATLLGSQLFSLAAPWDKALSRYVTRTENSGERLALSLDAALDVWLWILLSTLVFLALAMLFAVVDRHMLGVLREGGSAFATALERGIRTLLATFRDRHTPHRVRLIPLVGLVYWLLPVDLLADDSILPGYADDVLVAFLCAKLFVHFCPDGVIAKHASEIQRRAAG